MLFQTVGEIRQWNYFTQKIPTLEVVGKVSMDFPDMQNFSQ